MKREATMTILKMVLLLILPVILAAIAAAAPPTAKALPGCPDSCGNLTIPYPFGTSKGCYLNHSFLITCDDSYKTWLGESDIPVLNISLNGELLVSISAVYDCYKSDKRYTSFSSRMQSQFFVSYTRNKFTAVGCDTKAAIRGSVGQKYYTGCMSFCYTIDDVVNGSCSGIGCCQASIPKGVRDFKMDLGSYYNHTWTSNNPCSFAFVVEEGRYNFSSLDLPRSLSNSEEEYFPVVLDWAIGNKTCDETKKDVSSYACGNNSICHDSDNGPGYRCKCSPGYEGNPYLPNGCQDINECLNEKLHNCTHICNNTRGSFTCSCPKGYHGDGIKGSQSCNEVLIKESIEDHSMLINVTVGIGITVMVLVVGCSWLYCGIRKRKLMQRKENFFQQNGGLILQQLLSKLDGSVEAAKIFTIKELKKATNDFNESEIIGRGGFGTVYKGVLPLNKIVAIKKSLVVDQSQLDQFVNEVIVLSQINHRNVVKLLGCCLEAEVPLLVYEFITNGTLSRHIHELGLMSLPWDIRLRIAKETAGALSYLHSAASIPIIHRDVKSTNILLDDNLTAKVSDFGASRLVPLDKTQLTTMVQGTLGYLDPEYFHTSQLSEKSDVYSFGVLLVELLTGKKALSFDRPEKERNSATYFISSMKENRLFLILDDRIVNECNVEQVREVANIAQNCLRLKGDERPTMKEVAIELEGLARVEKHLCTSVDENQVETEHLLGESLDCVNTSTSVGYDSLRNQAIIPLEVDGGR